MAIAPRGFPWGPGRLLAEANKSTRRDRPGSWLAPCGDTSFAGGSTPIIHVPTVQYLLTYLGTIYLFSGMLWGVSEVGAGCRASATMRCDAMLLARELSHIEAIPASGADVGVDM